MGIASNPDTVEPRFHLRHLWRRWQHRKLTQEMTETIRHKYQLDVAAHLTCVDASKDETLAVADAYMKSGVTQIVALRRPAKWNWLCATSQGFSNAIELVTALANAGVDKIHVGAYPDASRGRYKMLMLIG